MRWVSLSLAGISCLTVWAFVILTVFAGDEVIYNNEEQALENQTSHDIVAKDMPTTAPAEVVDLEKETEGKGNARKEIIRKRGIQKDDFAHIAPNREISIDELLAFFEED